MKIALAILAALGVAVGLAAAFPARAHDLYAWINDGGYKAADGSHCCGWKDCVELRQSEIGELRDAWTTPYGLIDKRAVYQSRDGKVWVCRRHHAGATPESSCLFVPGGG